MRIFSRLGISIDFALTGFTGMMLVLALDICFSQVLST